MNVNFVDKWIAVNALSFKIEETYPLKWEESDKKFLSNLVKNEKFELGIKQIRKKSNLGKRLLCDFEYELYAGLAALGQTIEDDQDKTSTKEVDTDLKLVEKFILPIEDGVKKLLAEFSIPLRWFQS